MRPTDPWILASALTLVVLCFATVILITAGAEAARVNVLAIAALIYALAALARAVGGPGGRR